MTISTKNHQNNKFHHNHYNKKYNTHNILHIAPGMDGFIARMTENTEQTQGHRTRLTHRGGTMRTMRKSSTEHREQSANSRVKGQGTMRTVRKAQRQVG